MLGVLSVDKENLVSGWIVFPNFDGWNHFKKDNWLILKFYSIVKRNQSILPEHSKRDVSSSLRMTQTWKMHTELRLSVLNEINNPCLQNSPTQKILLLHLHHVNDPVKIQTKKDNCFNIKMQLPILLVSRFLSAVPNSIRLQILGHFLMISLKNLVATKKPAFLDVCCPCAQR